MNFAAENRADLIENKYGRHEETRTPDLYRVKLFGFNTFNNLVGYKELPKYLIVRSRRNENGCWNGC